MSRDSCYLLKGNIQIQVVFKFVILTDSRCIAGSVVATSCFLGACTEKRAHTVSIRLPSLFYRY